MNLLTFDLNLLLVFEALYNEGNVTAAGKRIGMSQPAVSAALRRLRGHFNDGLFVRVGQRMVPTSAAVRLERPIAEALATLRREFQGAQAFDPAQMSHTFRIAISDYFSHNVLPRLIAKLTAAAPRCSFLFRTFTYESGIDFLERDDVEMILGFFPRIPPHITRHPVLTDRSVCIFRQGHPVIDGAPTMEQYCELPHAIATISETLQARIDTHLSRLGLKRNIVVMLPNHTAVPHIVARTDLIATIPAGVVTPLLRPLGLVACPLPFQYPEFVLNIYWHQRSEVDTARLWLRRSILDALN